ncbi:P-selectin glycoprotein ligand 1-like [Myxocyprinus asiaticus]|uniref:P-selectin glycoprotein ligand 1-like n=1 Tax=Myxocyprinus asiaticus TaxID=70543 RepID=UPI0022233A3D|nr:P-selectin glycoprotein ligand 1-like [Myxocyprinus asiaticus]
MVTNRLWCVPVLVLLFTLNNLVTSRYLSRMKKEISYDTTSTNTTDRHSTNITGPETVKTTVDHLKAMSAQTIEVKTDRPDLNDSVTSMDHQNISDSSHTQKNEGNETSGNHFKGTESVTVSQPTGNENTSYTQLPKRNDSIGHISQAGSSAPTFPALVGPGKVTEIHTTAATTKIPLEKSTTSTAPRSTASRIFKNQTSTTEKAPLCFTASQRDGLVSHCLIAIASMAALTTIFIISTICLATKLSRYRYRHKSHLLQETEMVCISALMNDTDHPVPKLRHPKSNGALIPNTEDGDPDGDNLTLNSFLPDNDGPL